MYNMFYFRASKTLSPTTHTAILGDFQCDGTEDNLGLCHHGGWENVDCRNDDVAIACALRAGLYLVTLKENISL